MLYCRRKISYQEMKVSDLEEITQSVIEAVDNASHGIMKIYNSDVVHVKNKMMVLQLLKLIKNLIVYLSQP